MSIHNSNIFNKCIWFIGNVIKCIYLRSSSLYSNLNWSSMNTVSGQMHFVRLASNRRNLCIHIWVGYETNFVGMYFHTNCSHVFHLCEMYSYIAHRHCEMKYYHFNLNCVHIIFLNIRLWDGSICVETSSVQRWNLILDENKTELIENSSWRWIKSLIKRFLKCGGLCRL